MPYPLLLPALFFSLGIYCGNTLNSLKICCVIFLSLLLLTAAAAFLREKHIKFTALFAGALWGSFLALGLVVGGLLAEERTTAVTLPTGCLDRPEQWQVKLTSAPERRISPEGEISYRAFGEIHGGRCLEKDQLLPIKIRLILPDGAYFPRGELTVLGRLAQLHGYHNFGVYDFGQADELRGYHYRLKALAVQPLNNAGFFDNLWQQADSFRRAYGELLLEKAPTAASGQISQAMILGIREQQNPELRRRHALAGTSHLLAISGLHVGFALGAVFFLLKIIFSLLPLRRWPAQKPAAAMTIAFLLIYVLFTGASWSTVRAGIMALMVFGALISGRQAVGLNNLALAAFIILLIEPSALFTPGFLLSFTAAAGLIVSHPLLNWCPFAKNTDGPAILKYFWQLLLVSIVATVFTAPLSSYFFQQISLSGPVSGLLAIPLAAMAVASGSLGAVLTPLSSALAGLLATLCGYLCYFIDLLAGFFANLNLPQPQWRWSWPMLFLYYPAIICLMRWPRKIWRYSGLGALALLIIITLGRYLAEPSPRLTMLDVGQGEAILLSLPGHKHILIDTGGNPNPLGRFDVGEQLTVPALKALGVKELEMVIITHNHPDHIGGLAAVKSHFKIKQLITNRTAPLGLSTLWTAAGSKLTLYRLPENFAYLNENNHSLLLRFETDKQAIILAGDNEKPAEEIFIKMLPAAFLQADYLQIGHHGSNTATSPEWLKAVNPKTALISCGYHNSFGLPNLEVIELLNNNNITIRRTDYEGAIQIDF